VTAVAAAAALLGLVGALTFMGITGSDDDSSSERARESTAAEPETTPTTADPVSTTATPSSPPLDEVARTAAERGSYAEAGSGIDAGDLADALNEFGGSDDPFIAVALAEDPAGGAVVFADRVLDFAGTGTVLVLSPGFIAYRSTEHDDASLEAAYDAASRDLDADPLQGVVNFARALR
jgi:hypothetical protein